MAGNKQLIEAVGLGSRFTAKNERREFKLVADIGDVDDSNLFGVLNCGRTFKCGTAACPVCSERFGKKFVLAIHQSRLFKGQSTAVSVPDVDEDFNLIREDLQKDGLARQVEHAKGLLAGSAFGDAIVVGAVHVRSTTLDMRLLVRPLRTVLLINRPLDDELNRSINDVMIGAGGTEFVVHQVDPIETLRRMADFYKSPFAHKEVDIETATALGAYAPQDRLVLHNAELKHDSNDQWVFASTLV